jgi:hypothetical protein
MVLKIEKGCQVRTVVCYCWMVNCLDLSECCDLFFPSCSLGPLAYGFRDVGH